MSKEQSKKSFFKSKLFKWIMIIILEAVSLFIGYYAIIQCLQNNWKILIVYLSVCLVLSLSTLFNMNKIPKKAKSDGTIRIMDDFEYNRYQINKNTEEIEKMLLKGAFNIVISPIVAPYAIGTAIYNIIL